MVACKRRAHSRDPTAHVVDHGISNVHASSATETHPECKVDIFAVTEKALVETSQGTEGNGAIQAGCCARAENFPLRQCRRNWKATTAAPRHASRKVIIAYAIQS